MFLVLSVLMLLKYFSKKSSNLTMKRNLNENFAKLITLKWLTFKLAMLVALVSGQRCQTLHCLNLDNLDIFSDKAVFHITELLKHSRLGVYLKPIEK